MCCLQKKKLLRNSSTEDVNMNVHHHHHHHVVLVARISLTLSRHSSLSFIASGRSSGQHPVSSHSCWMYVRAGLPAFARPCVGVHKSASLMSSSLLLQQCPACLVRLTWIVFVIGGRTYKMKRSFFQAAVTSILLYGCTTWTQTKRLEKKLDGNYTRMLRAILNKSRRQHPTRHELYGHLPPMNVQWTQFANFLALNNPRWVDMPLKPIPRKTQWKLFVWRIVTCLQMVIISYSDAWRYEINSFRREFRRLEFSYYETRFTLQMAYFAPAPKSSRIKCKD